jgi:hypothetical protein
MDRFRHRSVSVSVSLRRINDRQCRQTHDGCFGARLVLPVALMSNRQGAEAAYRLRAESRTHGSEMTSACPRSVELSAADDLSNRGWRGDVTRRRSFDCAIVFL